MRGITQIGTARSSQSRSRTVSPFRPPATAPPEGDFRGEAQAPHPDAFPGDFGRGSRPQPRNAWAGPPTSRATHRWVGSDVDTLGSRTRWTRMNRSCPSPPHWCFANHTAFVLFTTTERSSGTSWGTARAGNWGGAAQTQRTARLPSICRRDSVCTARRAQCATIDAL